MQGIAKSKKGGTFAIPKRTERGARKREMFWEVL